LLQLEVHLKLLVLDLVLDQGRHRHLFQP
jgi:hypothetical protein